MKVKLISNTPLEIADIAICKCYGNEPHSDSEKVKARINRVANVSKHASTIEHLSYSFDIDGVSRACLQEICRHRVSSYTVKSSRYTLQELKKEHIIKVAELFEPEYDLYQSKNWDIAKKYIVTSDWYEVDLASTKALGELQSLIEDGVPNDVAKYCMPEAYKTSLVMTINARALQNFLTLRSSKHALKEIQELARNMFEVLPQDHKFLFEGIFINEQTNL